MDDAAITQPCWRISLGEDVRLTDRNGNEAKMPLRKVRAIVAILAGSPEHRVARHRLTALLWSDRGPEQARASLRQCLFTLRSEAPTLVEADSEAVWLTEEAVAACDTANCTATLSRLGGVDPEMDRWLAERRGRLPTGAAIVLPAGSGKVAGRRRIPRFVALALACVVLLATAGAWWWHRRLPTPAPAPTVIALAPFAATPDSGPATAIAERMRDDLRTLLPADRAVIREGDAVGGKPNDRPAADWITSGSIDARGNPVKVHIRVETADGRVIWTRDVDAPPDRLAAAAAIAATRTAMTTGCVLGGPRVHRSADVLALLFTACDRLDFSADDYNDETALVALQRLAERAPNDALAQAYYGTGLAVTAEDMPPPIAKAQRVEAARRLDRAQRLDARVGEAWIGRFALIDDNHAYRLQESLLARGLAVEPNNPTLNMFMGGLLSDLGRGSEALVFEQRAAAFAPAYLKSAQLAAGLLSAAGRPREALALLDIGDRHFPDNAEQAWQRLDALLASGDTVAVRALLDRAANIHGFLEPEREAADRRLTYAMDQPHGALADAIARDAVAEADTKPERAARSFNTLVQLGRIDAAWALALRHPLPPEVFFQLQARPILLKPQFPLVARRIGLWDYWRRSGRWPDICRDPQRPWRCGPGVKSALIPG